MEELGSKIFFVTVVSKLVCKHKVCRILRSILIATLFIARCEMIVLKIIFTSLGILFRI